MFMNLNHSTIHLLVLPVNSLLVILNDIKFPLQNRIYSEVSILASKILPENRFHFYIGDSIPFLYSYIYFERIYAQNPYRWDLKLQLLNDTQMFQFP